ncbi:MAG: hypothetical protein P0S95_06790 [Rhabdochlamydiaceae bacterium]|nr:hypothetical protein [Candidatus Amphrikana amoebophyrae]
MSHPSVANILNRATSIFYGDHLSDKIVAASFVTAVIAGSTKCGIETVVKLTNTLGDASIGELWCCQLPKLLTNNCPISHPYFTACIVSVNTSIPILETIAVTSLAVAAAAGVASTIRHLNNN